MSALDVSDPFISMAYDAVAQNNPLRWFLLAYSNKPNQLRLCASGPGDIEELRTHITPGDIQFGIFREHDNDSILCISFAVIPDTVRGVHRARALVHASAVSSMFKTHQVLNASNADDITIDALRNALRLPPRGTAATMLGPNSTRPTHIDSGISQPPSGLSQPPSGASQPPSGSSQPLSSLTPPSESSIPFGLASLFSGPPPPSNSEGTSSQSRSHRKPPPRLSMPPTTTGPARYREHQRTGSSSQTRSGQPPSATRDSPPSPSALHSPAASPVRPSAFSPPVPQPAHDSATSAPMRHIAPPNELRSWLAKQEAPLPPPPADPEPKHNDGPPLKSKAAFVPKSAFESDEESSEVDYGVPMHGPLSEINVNVPSARAPASPIGSIPSEASVHSEGGSPARKPSPIHEPSPPDSWDEIRHTDPKSALSDAPAPGTPAQEEAVRARNGWTAPAEQTDNAEDPGRPAKQTSPAIKVSSREDASHTRGVASPMQEENGVEFTRRRAATEAGVAGVTEESHYTPPAPIGAAHRRIVSQDVHRLSHFLERASPERLEEERRIATLDEERRRRAAERAQREREERAEEEARERAFTERKERERARRVEMAKQAEVRRAEERRREEEARAEREAKEAREREAREAKDREARARAQQRIEGSRSGMELLSGFITIEMASVWRRRYFRLSTESWLFFRNDKDETPPVHVIELARIRALREWNEGYEELEAIPHSFAVELMDEGPWPCFADSAEDKEILLGLLNQAAGL